MRALIAGGAGFIGSHLTRALVEAGAGVTVLDNLSTGRLQNIEDLRGRIRLFVADVTGEEPVVGYPWRDPRPDVVIHLASPASPVDYERLPLETLAANSTGTRHLLHLAHAVGARFIYASSSEVYGNPAVHPQPETYHGDVDPIGPRSMYDEGKRFGEALVTAARSALPVRAAILRLFNTYGPAMRLDDGRAVPAFIDAALAGRPLLVHGHGHQTRSFMYVSDAVEALMAVAHDDELDGLVANVGNPEEVEVEELARRVHQVAWGEGGVPIRYVAGRPGDPVRRQPNVTRMRERYDWRPRIDLWTGLRRTVEWAREEAAR